MVAKKLTGSYLILNCLTLLSEMSLIDKDILCLTFVNKIQLTLVLQNNNNRFKSSPLETYLNTNLYIMLTVFFWPIIFYLVSLDTTLSANCSVQVKISQAEPNFVV